jgi:ligand-binding sensor domain-containing protein
VKRILTICLIATSILTGGCKKDRTAESPDTTNAPDETIPEWVSYNTSNSTLPNNQINAIAIDRNDVKWIGTANGLVCIKGNNLTVYNTANSSLPSSFIQALAVESDGTLWIGTDKGLAKLKGTAWNVYTTANSVLTSNGIKCIAHDSKNKITWVGTEEDLVKVNSSDNFEYIVEAKVIQSMAVDHDGALWMGVFNDFAFIGLIKKYNNGQWTSYRLDQMGHTSALPYGMAIDKNNHVVALLAGTVMKSVIRFDGTAWAEIPRLNDARGLKAIAIEDDKIWVGGSTFSQFGEKNSPLIKLPDTDSPILSMAVDSKGRKWLGTYYGGVFAYNSNIKKQ